MKLIAAMSGGVDSAVAAARAVEAGHDVIGVHLALSSNPQKYRSGARGCCTVEDSHDARRAADVIGIPFYIWDMAQEFHKEVVENFLAEYSAGRTPNPCLRCNEKIKFAAVLDRARAMKFDGVVTGHYAITKESPMGKTLHRAIDETKDQSYVLSVLTIEQIQGAIFPLGDTRKTDIRKEAKARGLFVANKPDSHDICFVPSGDNAGWLRDRLGSEIGPIVDQAGHQVGQHKGAYTYTIGQRRGLGLSVPTIDGSPRFVLKVEPETNTVVVGSREDLAVSTMVGENPVWCGPSVDENPKRGFVQIRAHGQPLACTYYFDGGLLTAQLDEPIFGLATGQAMAIYDGDRVVGSATICETHS
ncbi:MAG: tRNA 2-thiouridine(34) synthase MnmA [Candidatus Nanopelagicaceae bacterium]|nr:tRNA 2-thiouridine(34) synthase MnmA [Candidatus Nanopelagicaceae bacterium]